MAQFGVYNSARVNVGNVFPDGTLVSAYLARDFPVGHKGSPVGQIKAQTTVEDGVAFFQNRPAPGQDLWDLVDGERYIATAQVSGVWRQVGFSLDPQKQQGPRSDSAAPAGTMVRSANFEIGYNPAVDNWPADTARWGPLTFVVVTDKGGGNRVFAPAMILTGIDPPELGMRGQGPNNTAPYGPNDDGTDMEAAPIGRGAGRLLWQLMTPQGRFAGWIAHLGVHGADVSREDNLNTTLASQITLPQSTIEVNGNLDSVASHADGTLLPWYQTGEAQVGGQTVFYRARDANTLFACTGGTGTHAAGATIKQHQISNPGTMHIHTSSPGTNDRADRIRINPDGPVIFGEQAISESSRDAHWLFQGGSMRVKAARVPTNFTSTVVGTSGAASIIYNLVGNTADGRQTAPVPATISTAPNTLSASHYVKLDWEHSSAGIESWDVVRSEVQRITVDATAGQIKLTFSGQQTADIAFNASAATMQTALEALSNIAPGDVVVSGGPGNSGGTTPYFVTFGGVYAGTNVAEITAVNGTTPLSGGGASVTVSTILAAGPIQYRRPANKEQQPGAADYGQAPAGLNEVQTVVVRNTTSGTFRLAFGGGETNAINWNATASDVQTKLQALGSIGSGNATVTSVGESAWRVEFTGALAAANVDQLTLRLPHDLINDPELAEEPEEGEEPFPAPSVVIRTRTPGGPVVYTLPTRDATADLRVDGALIIGQPGESTPIPGAEEGIQVFQEPDTGQLHSATGFTTEDWQRPDIYAAETIRRVAAVADTGASLASGTLALFAIELHPMVVSAITFVTELSLATPTHQWFALYDKNRNLLRQTVNDTNVAWAADSFKTLNLTSTYEITTLDRYYLGVCVVAGTPGVMAGSETSGAIGLLTPALFGRSTTGLTGTAPATAAAITSQQGYAWAGVTAA